jgi:uncharacterized protein (DUF1684 family)
MVLRLDQLFGEDLISMMSAQAQVQAWRDQRDAYFRSDDTPLSDDKRDGFEGIPYYDYDANLDFIVHSEPYEQPESAQIFTTQDTIRNYGRFATFTVTIDDQPVTLTIYSTPHGLFLPFVDGTAQAGETYGGGRYIDVEQLDDETFRVDFNRAYHPYCVYNPHFDCPIPPAENRVSVPIRAGERL